MNAVPTDADVRGDVTSAGGFAAALDACHDVVVPAGVVASREGLVVASARRLPDAPALAGSSGALAATRAASTGGDAVPAAFADALLALHRAAVAGVLSAALDRLGARQSEGAGLLNRQLVRGAAADVALALAEADDLLALPAGTPARRWLVHRDLVAAGRTAIKLHGASGFAADGAGPAVYLAELLGHTYLHPGWRDGADD
ncbi:hypothetical protein [Streptomyces marincola]|uniref:Acyl-CoA dehydrogenase/oxidase C-terminal domain-containing protein n=1 Tax=Streptomyces marincola TaxID=2878388 RepID=A0A1W7CUP8_9ACTN|nr:hypothetical protein [Streptomyces marincola]ARQ68467.1 hypothetical protein CAG99_06010 [Streptomyces marincola]